jgi:hypothetical protein
MANNHVKKGPDGKNVMIVERMMMKTHTKKIAFFQGIVQRIFYREFGEFFGHEPKTDKSLAI